MKKCRICQKPYKDVSVDLVDEENLVFSFPDCNCYADKYDTEQKQRVVHKLLDHSNIYHDRWKDDLKDFRWAEGYLEARKVFGHYLKQLRENITAGRGLFLFGPKGTGKTRLSCYVLVKIMKSLLIPCQYYHTTELFDLLREPQDRFHVLERCRNVKVLLIDDIGESIADYWIRIYLKQIINHRYERKKTLLVNSMRSIEELRDERYLGEHMLSRLIEVCDVAEIKTSADYRKQGVSA